MASTLQFERSSTHIASHVHFPIGMSAAWITVSLAFCKGLGRAQPSAEVRAPKNNPPTQDPFGTDTEGHWIEETLPYNTSGDSGATAPTPFESMTSTSRPSSRRQSRQPVLLHLSCYADGAAVLLFWRMRSTSSNLSLATRLLNLYFL